MSPAATAAFNPALVNSTDAFNWCNAQLLSCPLICGKASANQCNPVEFTWDCVCANGTTPDCTRFYETLPYFICEATYQQCFAAHPNNLTAQGICIEDEKCAYEPIPTLGAASPGSSTTTSSTPRLTSSVVPGSSSRHSLSRGSIAGIAVASVVTALIGITLAVWVIQWRKRKAVRKTQPSLTPMDGLKTEDENSEKAELPVGTSHGKKVMGVHSKPEMETNANRHELGSVLKVGNVEEASAEKYELDSTSRLKESDEARLSGVVYELPGEDINSGS
jgi:hypothetical protein